MGWDEGQEMMHRVDKMNTEANFQEGKIGDLERVYPIPSKSPIEDLS